MNDQQQPKPEVANFAIPIDTVELIASDLELMIEATEHGGVAPALLLYAPGTGTYKVRLNADLWAKLNVQFEALDRMTEHERDLALLELHLGRRRS